MFISISVLCNCSCCWNTFIHSFIHSFIHYVCVFVQCTIKWPYQPKLSPSLGNIQKCDVSQDAYVFAVCLGSPEPVT